MKVTKTFLVFALLIISISVIYQENVNKQVPLSTSADYEEADVIVVGAGLAGLSSSLFTLLDAKNMGTDIKVIVLDKSNNFGGNSAKATSGINGAWTTFQQNAGISDTVEEFQKDAMKSYYNVEGDDVSLVNDKVTPLIKKLTEDSKDLLEFLNEEINLNIVKLSKLGGHSEARTHRQPNGPMGFQTVKAMKSYIDNHFSEQIQFRYNSKFTDYSVLQQGHKKSYIVNYMINNDPHNNKQIKAKAVIFAAGGYANDHTDKSLLKEFGGQKYVDLPTTNGDFATGDIVKLLRQKGVELVDMNCIQLHPTGFVDPKEPKAVTKFLAPEALRGSGGMIVNAKGERFVDELTLRSKVVEQMDKNKAKAPFYLILNEKAKTNFGSNFDFYFKVKKFFVEYDNSEAFANKLNIKPQVLSNSLSKYNRENKQGNSFTANEKLYVAQITPVIHYTMGGIKINKHAQVINNRNRIIDGFFAAGEVTGGVHGQNRLGGNSLLECVVYGSEAGRQAVQYINSSPNRPDLLL